MHVCDASCVFIVIHAQVHRYELHRRFGHLQAGSIPARLQLAALYAATSTLLPEPVSCQTGAQRAMQLLRQSWGDKPLTDTEKQQLRSVGMLGGHVAPGQCSHMHSHMPVTSRSHECCNSFMTSSHGCDVT